MRKNRTSSKNKKDKIGVLLILVGVLILIGLTYAYMSNSQKKIIDNKTLCLENGITGKTAIIIDRTDPLTQIQQTELKIRLNDIKSSIPIHASISLYGMDKPDTGNTEPEIRLCNPGTGENSSPWISNPELVKKVWTSKFSAQLDETISVLMEPQKVSHSPIMESIKAVSVAEFIGEKNLNIQKSLIIVSDMMQNTENYSQYKKNTFDFQSYKLSKSFEKTITDLKDVNVEILYIRRENLSSVQGKKHIEFWQKYVDAMGGNLVKVTSIN